MHEYFIDRGRHHGDACPFPDFLHTEYGVSWDSLNGRRPMRCGHEPNDLVKLRILVNTKEVDGR